MTHPLLSVIIPIYNVEAYLDTCLQSIRNQTLSDLEIILVDDGSPDLCPQMCDEYARQDARIKVIHKANAGLGYARNSGLDVATGKYVTFIDSDDYIETTAYETLCRIADERRLDSLRFTYNRFREVGRFLKPVKQNENLQLYVDKEEIRRLALNIFSVNADNPYRLGGSSCMAIYSRDTIEKNKLRFLSEREYMSEDLIFNFQFYLYASRVAYLPCAYYHYRINQYSLTQSVCLDRLERAEAYNRYVAQLIRHTGFPEADTLFALDYYIGMARGASMQVFMSSMPLKEKKAWFMKQFSAPYFREVVRLYPYSRIPMKQRICLFAMKYRIFWLTYMLVVGFTRLRSVTGK